MAARAYIEDPEVLAKFTASTDKAQFPVAVSPIDAIHHVKGSVPASPSGQALVTAQGEGIQIYSTVDSKCLRSWTFSPSIRFACPAKYYSRQDEAQGDTTSYVFVVLSSGDDISSKDQGTVLWRWTDRGINSVGIEEKIELRLAAPAFSLEPGVTAAGHLLVVHCDGSLTLTNHHLSKMHATKSLVPGQTQLIWYQLVDVSQSMRLYFDSRQVADWLSGDFMLAMTLVRVPDPEVTDAYAYHVSLLAINGTESCIVEVGTTQVSPSYLVTQPLACAFDADTGLLAMLTESGVYQQLSLSLGSSALDDPILLEMANEVVLRGFVPCTADIKQGGRLASNLLTQSLLSLTALTENYVAIVGTHSVVSHSNKGPYESVLSIWDLQYGCLHAEKSLPIAPAHLLAGAAGSPQPRLLYQVQTLSPRLNESGEPNDQVSIAVTVSYTADAHAAFDIDQDLSSKNKKKKKSAAVGAGAVWSVETFVASALLPTVTLLGSLRLKNNAKYFVGPVEQPARASTVHSSNILLHEEQEQGLGVLRSGWEAIVDDTSASLPGKHNIATSKMFWGVRQRRETTQQHENEVLLALSNVSDAVNGDQYTQLFMDHIGVKAASSSVADDESPTWISAHLMTTVMRRCFAEPLGLSRSSQLPLFAPRVIEFMLLNCGLCNAHAPAPGLLPHLLARVDLKRHSTLSCDPAWVLANISMRQCPDLPETHVVDALVLQLTHYSEHSGNLFALPSKARSGLGEVLPIDVEDISADIAQTVGTIASINGNEDLMRMALTRLSLDHVACVVRLLLTWLRGWASLGANVEIAASAKYAADSSTELVRDIGGADSEDDEDDGTASAVQRVIAEANSKLTLSSEGVPAVDASLTAFIVPALGAKDKDASSALVRSFTKRWAPALELPSQLVGAPELGRVVDFASLLLDAHISNIVLSQSHCGLIKQLTKAVNEALAISDQLKLLRIGLIPFHLIWETQMEERAANSLAKQKRDLGLDEVVLANGMTKTQAERQKDIQPNVKCAQGVGAAGTYWERVQNLEKYRVEVMHW
ncbi:hypothetical protein GGI04_000295 [Coemansia thaxteri]|uniref:Uncharacterized protein n=1 Tax=Coemansia thaxteri TaxID=2663907 RepID=A0A9W8EIX7_9FUNG|nr:hypothetical protein H4R26_003686 [Coemansia thaxteri]KAJ2009643.1 hypothetical protein GGI04_000295 [Coemansia thaxteri]KAJ2474264.1 hypothetical protein GGI02_000240 [Coemansia sp. RSA 2322]